MWDRIYITIILCIIVSLPFIFFQNKLSTLGTPVKYTKPKDEKKSYFSTIIFSLLILLHTPVIYSHLLMSTTTSTLMMVDYLLFVAYYVFAFILLYMDPSGMISTPKYTTTVYLIIMACLLMILLFTGVNVYLLLLFIYGLCICGTIIISRRSVDTRVYYIIGYVVYAILYIFLLKPDILKSIIDGMNDTKKEDKTPPISVSPYLYVSVLFFLLLFMLPSILKLYNDGTTLINEPVLLNVEREFKVVESYPYSLSFWINMESVPPEYNASAAKYTNIVSISNLTKCQYNNTLSKIRILFTINEQEVFIEKTILPQRWNHVVIVNDGAIVDLYINGKLTNSISNISRMRSDLTVGEKNGVVGQLCNFIYYNYAISSLSIQQLYQQLRMLDPPVI